jgi:hypothetical protein
VSEESWEKKKKKISALVAKTRMRNFGHKKTMPNTPPAKKARFLLLRFYSRSGGSIDND